MTIHWADSAGAQGLGDGSSPANAISIPDAAASSGDLANFLIAGDTVWCKNGTELLYDTADGYFINTAASGSVANPIRMIGYGAVIGDGGVVEIRDTGSATSNGAMSLDKSYWSMSNFKITGCWLGVVMVQGCSLHNIEITGCRGYTLASGNLGTIDTINIDGCYLHDPAGSFPAADCRTGSIRITNTVFKGYVGVSQFGHGTHGVIMFNTHFIDDAGVDLRGEVMLMNCSASGSSGDGFNVTNLDSPTVFINCTAWGNAGYGLTGASGTIQVINCDFDPAGYENTSGAYGPLLNIMQNGASLDGSTPDFVDEAGGNYTLGDNSEWKGAGASIGGAGWDGTPTTVNLGPYTSISGGGGGGGGGIAKHVGRGGGLIG